MLRRQHGIKRVDIRPNMDRSCVHTRVRHMHGVHLSEYFNGRDGLIISLFHLSDDNACRFHA
jgi:hypothetical protein